MNILKFVVFETGVALLITFLTSVIGIFGLNYADPKFDAWGNVGLRLILSAFSIALAIGFVTAVLAMNKQFPVSPRMATTFAIGLSLYLEAYRVIADKYELTHGTLWLPVVYSAIVPTILGILFFLKVKY